MTAVLVSRQGVYTTELGSAIWITVERADGRRMPWSEVCSVFNEEYPGHWAVQVFPPADRVFDNVNRYHLWVLDHEPSGFDIGGVR